MVWNDVSTSRQWLSVNTCADWKMPIIDSFHVHSKICWKLQERYICRFVRLYWVYFDRCCPLFNNVHLFNNIPNIDWLELEYCTGARTLDTAFLYSSFFLPRDASVQSAVMLSYVIRLSVCTVYDARHSNRSPALTYYPYLSKQTKQVGLQIM